MNDERSKREWHELAREPVADCRIFKVERSTAVSPFDASRRQFYRIQSPDWAQVLPITPQGDAVLVRQYRHGPQRVTIEMPGGLIEPGEEPAKAALRECLEETGYRAPAAVPLGVVNPNPAMFANRLHAFVAEGAELVQAIQNSGTEQTEVVLVPAHELRAMLLRGDIDHALVAGTLWRYLHEYRRQ